MKPFLTAGILLLGHGVAWAQAASSPNQLTVEEQKGGWRLLFDGQTTKGWRGFRKTDFPTGKWVVRDGCLERTATGTGEPGGGDIVTLDTFSEFDLRFEWRIAPGGNSGVKYFVTEERKDAIGHEYQVLDDARHADAKVGPIRQTAAFYDVLPSVGDKPLRPAGEWNQSRILVERSHVEHWLNGRRVLEYELGSPAVKEAVARSKFKDVAGFGTRIKGHVLLQDHGAEVCYRSIKILSPPH